MRRGRELLLQFCGVHFNRAVMLERRDNRSVLRVQSGQLLQHKVSDIALGNDQGQIAISGALADSIRLVPLSMLIRQISTTTRGI